MKSERTNAVVRPPGRPRLGSLARSARLGSPRSPGKGGGKYSRRPDYFESRAQPTPTATETLDGRPSLATFASRRQARQRLDRPDEDFLRTWKWPASSHLPHTAHCHFPSRLRRRGNGMARPYDHFGAASTRYLPPSRVGVDQDRRPRTLWSDLCRRRSSARRCAGPQTCCGDAQRRGPARTRLRCRRGRPRSSAPRRSRRPRTRRCTHRRAPCPPARGRRG